VLTDIKHVISCNPMMPVVIADVLTSPAVSAASHRLITNSEYLDFIRDGGYQA